MIKKNVTILVLLFSIILFLSGCINEVEKYTYTQEELEEVTEIPKYKITLGEEYLKLEKQNEGEHLVPLDLLRIVFPKYLSELPDDGLSRYVKAGLLEDIPGINLKVTDNTLEIGLEKDLDNEINNYVNLKWEEPLGYVFLVNKEFPLNSDYEDQSLTAIKSPYLKPLYNNMRLAEEAFKNMEIMAEDFYLENQSPMVLVSTYRDYDHQERIFNNRIASNRSNFGMSYEEAYKKASEIIAIPGTSEHQSGLAVDFSNMKMIQQGRTLVKDFSKEKEGKWLLENGSRYGFILRYPEDKTEITEIVFEPWHYRYVGYPHSEIISEKKWTLEEYHEEIENKKKITWENYSLFYLESEKIFGNEIYYDDSIKIENNNKGGWILTKKN